MTDQPNHSLMRFLAVPRFSLAFVICSLLGAFVMAIYRAFITDAYGPVDLVTAFRRVFMGAFLISAIVLLPTALVLRKLKWERLTQFATVTGAVFFLVALPFGFRYYPFLIGSLLFGVGAGALFWLVSYASPND